MPTIEILPPGPAPPRQHARSRASRRSSRPRSAWIVACVLAGVLTGTAAGLTELWVGDPRLPSTPPGPRLAVPHELVAPAGPERVEYPYSVVPGGVHQPQEAVDAAEADAVVAEHYRDVRLAALQAVVVERPRSVHVSYRIGDRVYWTKRKVPLKAGEWLLSDGKATIRARCGNCISDIPMGPTSDEEPPPEVFDTPVPTAGRTIGGGLTPLRAYDLLSSDGGLPPNLSGGTFTPEALVTSAGFPGLGWGGPGSAGGGFPGGLVGGGAPSSTGTLVPTDLGTTGDGLRTPGDPPSGGSTPPPPGGTPPPGGGTPPPSGGSAPPPSGGTPPPGGGTPPPSGGSTPPPPGGTPPPGGGTPPPGGLIPSPCAEIALATTGVITSPCGVFNPPPGEVDGGTGDPPPSVPEPATILLMGCGLALAAARRARRR